MLFRKKKLLNNPNQTVCLCLNISVGDLEQSIKEGHTTLESLVDHTNAGMVCMRCQGREKDVRGYREIYMEDVLEKSKSM